MGFARFMSALAGRLLHTLAGIALIIVGLAVVQGTGGIILVIVGLVPLVAGLLDFRGFAPLFGEPIYLKILNNINALFIGG
jgi:hypothetical protein